MAWRFSRSEGLVVPVGGVWGDDVRSFAVVYMGGAVAAACSFAHVWLPTQERLHPKEPREPILK